MFTSDISILAVVIASVVYFIIGGLWYTVLFAKPWTKLSGFDETKNTSGSALPYLFTYMLIGIISLVLAQVFSSMGVTSLAQAMLTALLIGVGFVGTTMTINALYANKPLALALIDTGYHITGILAAGVVLYLIT